MRRVTIIASASGNGKTTLDVSRCKARRAVRRTGRACPRTRLGRDAGRGAPRAGGADPCWREGWVVDGTYQRKLDGTLVLDAADTVVGSICRSMSGCVGSPVGRFGGWRDAKSSGTRTERRCGTRFGARDSLFVWALRTPRHLGPAVVAA